MPYIKPKDRKKWEELINQIAKEIEKLPLTEQEGNLNYLFSTILKKVYVDSGEKYFKYNRAIGLIECIKTEFYRIFVSKYEDKKIEENGKI